MALQKLVNGRELSGWIPMSEQLAKKTIEYNTIAYIKSNNDVKAIKETLKNGCSVCLLEKVLYEEMIADKSEIEFEVELHQKH